MEEKFAKNKETEAERKRLFEENEGCLENVKMYTRAVLESNASDMEIDSSEDELDVEDPEKEMDVVQDHKESANGGVEQLGTGFNGLRIT